MTDELKRRLHCCAKTEFYEMEQEAVDAWNARPIEDAQASEIKRLREEIAKELERKDCKDD